MLHYFFENEILKNLLKVITDELKCFIHKEKQSASDFFLHLLTKENPSVLTSNSISSSNTSTNPPNPTPSSTDYSADILSSVTGTTTTSSTATVVGAAAAANNFIQQQQQIKATTPVFELLMSPLFSSMVRSTSNSSTSSTTSSSCSSNGPSSSQQQQQQVSSSPTPTLGGANDLSAASIKLINSNHSSSFKRTKDKQHTSSYKSKYTSFLNKVILKLKFSKFQITKTIKFSTTVSLTKYKHRLK